ncbi:hypothetical protein ACLEPN_25295 [Myxococcus sp. 1LA]
MTRVQTYAMALLGLRARSIGKHSTPIPTTRMEFNRSSSAPPDEQRPLTGHCGQVLRLLQDGGDERGADAVGEERKEKENSQSAGVKAGGAHREGSRTFRDVVVSRVGRLLPAFIDAG